MKLSKEIKIALVAIMGVVILFFGMNFLKGMTLFVDKNVYYARFTDISGLSASNPIFANGYQVGIVKNIDFDYGGGDIVVKFSVNGNMHLPAGTTAEIESDFMGNVKMNLRLASGAGKVADMRAAEVPVPSFLSPGDTLQGMISQGLMGKAATLIPVVEQMIPKVDSILSSLNTLLADPALAASLHNVKAITSDLTTSTRQLNTLMASLNNRVPQLMDKADGVLANTEQLTANLSTLDIEATKAQIDQTIAHVDAVTSRLADGNGTIGLLMSDASLYHRLTNTMQSADNLLNDVREHPRRYINVSVFGRKRE